MQFLVFLLDLLKQLPSLVLLECHIQAETVVDFLSAFDVCVRSIFYVLAGVLQVTRLKQVYVLEGTRAFIIAGINILFIHLSHQGIFVR